ncbi:hypothetical protein BC936DRAFT_143432 [Jimgerdemannia flammicorona]|uniref:Sorting nexin C-terminal domain-containing protein n=1 Tax=Jimgerdemannia flammicorona TaxID=994334 RepID=A0A432ZZ78_9FUNG|nr:hypothetical protein BC936DRAFT_143432 [Jimgerdemannia flammicorona]
MPPNRTDFFISNRLLEYSIHILLGEDRLVYYLQLARETLWPGGQFMPPGEEVTEEEKLERRKEAERRLVMAMPGESSLSFKVPGNGEKLTGRHVSHIILAITPNANKQFSLFQLETGPLKLLLLGTSDDSQHFRAARDALEPLQLAECNRHLVLQMLDLVVARMCPELVAGEVGEQVKI